LIWCPSSSFDLVLLAALLLLDGAVMMMPESLIAFVDEVK
jgi:hypothetical protein